jgi:hypothetical protein
MKLTKPTFSDQVRAFAFLDAASEYRTRYGWVPIPVTGKRAATPWKKYQTERPSESELRSLFARSDITGIAIVCGVVSGGLVVRDFDRRDAYVAWASSHPVEAKSLPTVRTARGAHVYFRADLPDKVTTCEDGELRAGRGYVLAPPSRHPSGASYEWIVRPGRFIPVVPDPQQVFPFPPVPPLDPVRQRGNTPQPLGVTRIVEA